MASNIVNMVDTIVDALKSIDGLNIYIGQDRQNPPMVFPQAIIYQATNNWEPSAGSLGVRYDFFIGVAIRNDEIKSITKDGEEIGKEYSCFKELLELANDIRKALLDKKKFFKPKINFESLDDMAIFPVIALLIGFSASDFISSENDNYN